MATRKAVRLNLTELVTSAVALQDELRGDPRRRQILGRLYDVETDYGRVHFLPYSGPGVAQGLNAAGSPGGPLLFVSPWADLPTEFEAKNEPCPACLRRCDVCNGAGKATCVYTGCGGRGKIAIGEDPCPDCVVKSGRFDANCETCRGTGALPRMQQCPSCKGKQAATCTACQGTGKRSTGLSRNGKRECAVCRGRQRAGRWKPQNLAGLIRGKVGNYMVIGPVRRFSLRPIPGTGTIDRMIAPWDHSSQAGGTAYVRVTPGLDAAGQEMMILLPMVAHGGVIVPYFYGGSI